MIAKTALSHRLVDDRIHRDRLFILGHIMVNDRARTASLHGKKHERDETYFES